MGVARNRIIRDHGFPSLHTENHLRIGIESSHKVKTRYQPLCFINSAFEACHIED